MSTILTLLYGRSQHGGHIPYYIYGGGLCYLIISMEEVYAYLWVMDSARIIVLDGRTDTPLHS